MARTDFLSGTDTAALYALHGAGSLTGSEIHAAIEAKSSTSFSQVSIFNCLARMHKRGFVSLAEREKTYSDHSTRRVRYYKITGAGRNALNVARTLHEEMGARLAKVP